MTNCFSPYLIIKSLQQQALRKYASYLKGRVLDLGCGSRPWRKYLTASGQYVGMDEVWDAKPDVLGAAEKIPFSSDYFDSVICTEVLEHLPEPKQALGEIKRVLKTGGYLYLTVPQCWGLHYQPQDYYRFTNHGIKYLLEKSGFQVIALERIGGIFSLSGQRLIDVFWQLLVRSLKIILGLSWAERAASLFLLPFSLFLYFFGKIYDGIERENALGWLALAKK